MDDDRGLYDKYRVERMDDPSGKHAGCRYFVLDPEHDPVARLALYRYADVLMKTRGGALGPDLLNWLNNLEDR